MDNKVFKLLFSEIAKKHGFTSAYNGWFKRSNQCIVALELQKSNYSNYYQLNIKIFVHGMFNKQYKKSKGLLNEIGNVRSKAPGNFTIFLNLEAPLEDKERENGLISLFRDFIDPLAEQALSRDGIKKLGQQNITSFDPAVEKELERLAKE